MKPRLGMLAVALAVVLAPGAAHAADRTTPRVELRHDVGESVFLIASTVYVSALVQLGVAADAADECRWCTPPAFDRAARDALVSDATDAMHAASDLAAFALAPVSAFGLTSWVAAHDGRGDEAWENGLMIAEATSTTVAVTQVVKPAVARQRPAVHYREHGWERYGPTERNASFFSGHSSLAFALAVSSGTVASLRRYRLAGWVWGVGLPVAAFVAYSRVAADAHYLSDVLVGSAVGAGVGFALPHLLHGPTSPRGVAWRPTLIPVTGGAQAGVGGVF